MGGRPTQTTRHVEAHPAPEGSPTGRRSKGGARRLAGLVDGGWLVFGWFWMAVWGVLGEEVVRSGYLGVWGCQLMGMWMLGCLELCLG